MNRSSCVLAASLLMTATAVGQIDETGPPSAPGSTEPPIELFDTPELRIDGGHALSIRVVDSATGEPIEEFQAIAGVDVRDALVDPTFVAERGEGMIVNWQSHMLRQGKNGKFLWPLARAYDPLGLRIEASGYLPMRYTWIDKKRGSQTIVFRMIRDLGVVGVLNLPGGEPAAGAEIAIVMTSRSPRLKDCSFGPEPDRPRERWSRGVVTRADAQGQFTLPTETDPSAFVVAIHEGGTRQLPFAEFESTRLVELEAWGRVEGTVLVGSAPSAGEQVTAYNRHGHGAPYPSRFLYYFDLRSDEDGRFVIEQFPPGVGELALPQYIPRHDPTVGGWSHIPPIPRNSMGRFHVRSGETTVVTIGGEGLGERRVDPQDGKAKAGDGGGR